MRVGILSYPMLFQREGGLQIQVRSTIAALQQLPDMQVELIDPSRQRLDEFDIIHVFSTINGNHRLVEQAHDLQVPVVLSALLPPGWNRGVAFRARLADRLTGRLTGWNVQTSYAQTRQALQLADVVIALGDAERAAIMSAFGIEGRRILVLPNGISPQFFHADAELFRRHSSITGPFVLMVGAISPYKNQLGLVQALAASQLPIVLIGRAQRQHQPYLQRVLAAPGVRWMGQLDHEDPLLASAYAAASVLALPSHGEVLPLVALEAMAAGTPIVMTDESALHLPGSEFALKKLAWNDVEGYGKAITALVAAPPPRSAVQALVEQFTWQRVGLQIARCYADLAAAGRTSKRRQEEAGHAV